MKKQQIVFIVAVVIIFAGLIYLGVKQSNRPGQTGEPQEQNSLIDNSPANLAGISEEQASDWLNEENPSQSSPLEQSEVPEDAVKITITERGITPASFEVNKGEKVILSVASGDQWTHIFKFKSEILKDVAVGVGPKETRAIMFLASQEKGEYEYYCDVPGHEARGEKGVMIVK